MLTVRRVEVGIEGELLYECVDNSAVVGRLQARSHPDGALRVLPIEAAVQEAARSLLAAFERDAVHQHVPAIYLECHNEAEKDRYLSAGYNPMGVDCVTLFKKIQLVNS